MNFIGIILVFVPTIKSAKIDGMVGKMLSGRPFISMSLRHKRLDNFWFTLLHELGHLKYHFELLDKPIIENLDDELISDIEIEANIFALTAFIPRKLWNRTPLKYGRKYDVKELLRVANEFDVHPAIIAGRLRRENQDYTIFSDIVSEVDTREIIWENS